MRAARTIVLVLALAVVLIPGAAQHPVPASVTVGNENCAPGVTLSQIVWLRDGQVIGFQFLQVLVRIGQTYTVSAELSLPPTSAVVRGGAAGRPFEVTVPVGQTVKYPCGTISATSTAVPTPTPTPTPTKPEIEFPAGMPRPPISPGMAPAQLLSALQGAGAAVDVQGSEAKPKLGDAADPMLIGAWPGGYAATAIWVSTTGSLRVSVTYDRPTAFVWLWVVPVPNFWNTAMAWSPLAGGISVSVDRPQLYQPFTQWGNAPVPGSLFFVLVIKWDPHPPAAAMPYVISFSN